MMLTKHNNKVKIITALFVIVSLCDIVGILFDVNLLRLIFKPLIIATLLLIYQISNRKYNKSYVAALVFSFFGDVLLLFEGEVFFLLGLVSFFMAHIIFIKIVMGWLNKPTLKTIAIAIVPFLILFFALINLLKDSLNDLFVPVVVYGITISVMGSVSLIYYLNDRGNSALFMLIGASLFILSDSILAINKFYSANQFFPIVIMSTYVTAQYLIFKAVITEKQKIIEPL
ncbi:lysoplasmalogenase [Aureibaculum sp. 2210JD6-5]|uniref:lysoplasmalogenase n=1 Tax=Aureibaculum sp. 2210JD6-5 TaxID=3103957 RepID=UPI002AAE288F|nr:lysoplasmalogenase [Aureibaculum sp. 2210JD6-5]MDY7395242.1 lysoplasmalogenase [Aureibaculum sp. 2210JD6-5]